ncbi:MAG TPA: glutathione peroxidase [Ignavibacteria bacterium]|nr:glutathione peroxidase [Ignavibacteria bacterium]
MSIITKFIITLGISYFILSIFGCKVIKTRPENTMIIPSKSFYDITAKSIDGEEIKMSEFKGKKILIVNVASECGYTPQYKGMQKLYETYKDKLVVVGFPANDFGKQEPGTNEAIKKFCEKEFNVTFPMFEKISVKGEAMHPLYKWLTNPSENGWNDKAPNWNFCKYLVNESGELIKYYSFAIEPLSEEITTQIK